jgi:hypothetical protein
MEIKRYSTESKVEVFSKATFIGGGTVRLK